MKTLPILLVCAAGALVPKNGDCDEERAEGARGEAVTSDMTALRAIPAEMFVSTTAEGHVG